MIATVEKMISPEPKMLDAAIEKELLLADRFYENICLLSGWRLAGILKNARYCRESIDKAFAISGHTGHWYFDLWVYVVNGLPWFLPATIFLLPTIFYVVANIVSGALSYVTMEEKIVETTIKVPVWFFFTATKTISEVVMVPVTHIPDFFVSTTVTGIVILIGLAAFSYVLKAVFKFELQWRRRLLVRHIGRTPSVSTPLR